MNTATFPVVLVKCRICMGEFEEQTMTSLFEKLSDSQDRLGEKVQLCSGIRVRESAKMPDTACSSCCEFVERWANFRELCLNSQVYWETSCPDAKRPAFLAQASDTEYFEYLYDKLQINFADELEEAQEQEQDVLQVVVEEQLVDANSQDFDISDFIIAEQVVNEAEHTQEDARISAQGEPQLEEEYIEDTSQPVDDASHLKQELYEAEFDEEDEELDENDFLSPSPDPNASPLTKRRPGRPRKPDSDLKGKRKQNGAKRKLGNGEGQEVEQPTKFTCSLCSQVFDKKSLFTAHLMAHTDYKPNQCEICHKAFRQKGELRAHMRRHTGERPYKCAYCERHFYDRSERVRHERVHTNTRPYACQQCGKSFTHTAILKNHMLVHSGEKNYRCGICNKSFSLLHQLKAHLQTLVHRGRVEDSLAHPTGYVNS